MFDKLALMFLSNSFRPNFYQETLPSTPSPKKRRMNPDAANNSLSTSYPPPPHASAGGFPMSDAIESYHERSPERYMYDEDYRNMDAINTKQEPPSEFGWNPGHNIDHPLPHVKEEIMEPFMGESFLSLLCSIKRNMIYKFDVKCAIFYVMADKKKIKFIIKILIKLCKRHCRQN